MGDRGLLRPVVVGSSGGTGPSTRVYNEVLQGDINGTNKTFQTSSPFQADSIVVFINGVRLEDNEISVSGTSEVTLLIPDAPIDDTPGGQRDVVTADYDIA